MRWREPNSAGIEQNAAQQARRGNGFAPAKGLVVGGELCCNLIPQLS